MSIRVVSLVLMVFRKNVMVSDESKNKRFRSFILENSNI